MESKNPAQSRKPRSRNALKGGPGLVIIASSKLPERILRQLIRCYAERRSVKEAMAACQLSHVTVRKFYKHVRERLVEIGFYEARIAPDAPGWWLEQERETLLRIMRECAMPHQAVRDANLPLYYAEAQYRREEKTTPGQLTHLILAVIADYGPLNRPPRRAFPANLSAELLRLSTAAMRSVARAEIRKYRLKRRTIVMIDRLEEAQTRMIER